jgi:hypothetical protein
MNEYLDVNASMRRFVAQTCLDLAPQGFELTPLNLDAFANPTDWPKADFLGLSEFMLNTDGRLVDGAAAVVVSTREDVNLDRMAKIVNRVLDRLTPGKKIPIYETGTLLIRGHIHMVGTTRVGAVLNTDSQPAQPIFVRFKSDQTFRG